MPLDVAAIRRGCPNCEVKSFRHLCGAELESFRKMAATEGVLTVACTQQAAQFSEEAGERPDAISFVNIRETAGWSRGGARAGPKMAALLASAAIPAPDYPLVTLSSEGVILIYGRDEAAIEAGRLLADHLDVTVMLKQLDDTVPPAATVFPIVKGTIRSAKGHFGAFELAIDDYARPRPSSRDRFVFEPPRSGVTSRCDIVLDLSGGPPLFPAHDLRDGYLRGDAKDPAAVLRAVLTARDLVGSFDKPRYVEVVPALCAHSRSKRTGCHRCLDLCPTGAITPVGDHVAIDPNICAGCGQCAAACPTSAVSYALPPADTQLQRLRAMLLAYREAGGADAVLLFHDSPHGTPLIDALARHGDGLPANVLPFAVNELTQVGLEAIVGAFAYGVSAVRFLLRGKPRHDVTGLTQTIAMADAILGGLGFAGVRIATVETDDPDALGQHLTDIGALTAVATPATFKTVGKRRDLLRFALSELHRLAPQPVDVIALPQGAPVGAIAVDTDGCTLCLSCVSACPTGALRDDPERPVLKFIEDACVQCGLCQSTCPEKVISLKPQIDFRAARAPAAVIKEEEPALCVRCGTPFGVKSTIDRIAAKLEGRHWMYPAGDKRIEALRMCADCRVVVMSEQQFDPFKGVPERTPPRTTDDYLRERNGKD
ncbi:MULTISPECIES: 4Fe-4S binding protein [Bradyrhizobium]|uniref:4Fe-4S binding protein n=1 Tax=Bradyrhizobium TaxID=374 RepID=UPI00155F42A7|nr:MULTISPECIES: 4Fe-4S binding protein [Bradyrhizobium]MDD1518964.1 4Fe-4S ferredoxin [Bradyrhizobium sp. WBAH30]MDD1541038.1 4Fe-4S ferredoxin [Bradyrhizobium sp. WBAH41]MDD1557338.1 4Fe-4S ferredoxin [Bradyrhizobium sp. WBAH23]MDD1563673.1 4Fe-4S ferredoxin [Bradyrhizobium sp. WBAH33]MDD1590158.1 4Fe-4S ferredoxin [Bradyrhizobium sp. WBAH42]